MKNKLTMLMILDGFGDNKNEKGNAIELAKTPNIDELMKKSPITEVYTSGLNDAFPSGIAIGKVSKVDKDNYGLSKIVYVEPVSDINDITLVSVLKRKENK